MTAQSPEATSRIERLRAGVGKLGRQGGAPAVARWLMIGGGALMTLGIVVIVLGWAGAAHTPYVFEQMPYLISGGFLGASIAIIGGLLYFAYWMTRNLEESRAASDRTQDALRRIEELLGARASTNGSSAASNAKPFVKTARGTMFHRPDCVAVAGRDGLSSVRADGEGLEPCAVCDPLALV